MKQRSNKQWFGDFEFVSCQFEKGREKYWTEISNGIYWMQPKDNLLEDEEVNVSYRDKTNNEIHVVICQFTQFYSSNAVSQVTRIGGIPDDKEDLISAYRYTIQNLDENTTSFVIDSFYQKSDGIANPSYTNNNVHTWISILEGKLTHPETATYIFSCTGELQIAFYLSENQLTGNPDLDAEYLLNFQPSTILNYDQGTILGLLISSKGKCTTLNT